MSPMQTRLRWLGALAVTFATLCPVPARAADPEAELLALAKRLPPRRAIAPWIEKQCASVREARDVARSLGVWDEASAKAFAWNQVIQSLERLRAVAPEVVAEAADPNGEPVVETVREAVWPPALSELARSVAGLSAGCDLLAQGKPSLESLAALEVLLSEGHELAWAGAFFRQVQAAGPDAKVIAELARAVPTAASVLPPASQVLATAQERAERLIAAQLTELQREGVQKALEELGVHACKGESRRYASHLCGVVETFAAEPIDNLPERLKRAARADLAALPVHLAGASPEGREVAAAVAMGLVVLREVSEGEDVPTLVARLSDLSCGSAASFVCQSQVGAAARDVGAVAAMIQAETRWLERQSANPIAEASLTPEETAAVLLAVREWTQKRRPGVTVPFDAKDARAALRVLEAARRAYAQIKDGDRSALLASQLPAVLELIARRLPETARARRALASVERAMAGWTSGNIVDVAVATQELFRATELKAPPEAGDLVSLIVRLATIDSVDAALEALANAPGVQDAAASLMGFSNVPEGTFAEHPVRRKGASSPPEGLAKYVAGLRASYVYQHWQPREIPDAYYATTGLHLLRLELLLNQEELGFMRWLQAYLKFELKPGGEREQDELLRVVEKEESGWESLVGNLHTALPFLSSQDTLRGPTYSFKRRYFLASAQALQDYWYYSGGSVKLLVPGDTVSTATIFTRHRGGFRGTQLSAGKPSWSYEVGGYYLHYKKPYTHDRLAALPGSAIFDATFQGGGAFVEGSATFAIDENEEPWTATVALYGGPATILLDDVSAASVLPESSRIFMGEIELGLEMPAVWVGGAYLGGKLELDYRTFQDWFSDGNDPTRTNTQTLNDDLILGVSLVGGYFL